MFPRKRNCIFPLPLQPETKEVSIIAAVVHPDIFIRFLRLLDIARPLPEWTTPTYPFHPHGVRSILRPPEWLLLSPVVYLERIITDPLPHFYFWTRSDATAEQCPLNPTLPCYIRECVNIPDHQGGDRVCGMGFHPQIFAVSMIADQYYRILLPFQPQVPPKNDHNGASHIEATRHPVCGGYSRRTHGQPNHNRWLSTKGGGQPAPA